MARASPLSPYAFLCQYYATKRLNLSFFEVVSSYLHIATYNTLKLLLLAFAEKNKALFREYVNAVAVINRINVSF